MAGSLLRDLDPDFARTSLWDRLGLRPQPGPQEAFLNSEADISIFGGAAGGGKSFGELLYALQWVHVKGFEAVIFRRTTKQVTAAGGLWDDSTMLYPLLDGVSREHKLDWKFPAGARVSFAHMEYESNRLDWQGSQICLIAFDELTHFTWKQFNYMFSRNRSTCGVKPRILATTNPDSDSWVAEFISWWIDPETGFPIPERAGVLRYFVQMGDDLIWGDSAEELLQEYPDLEPRSVTFIPSKLSDNPALTSKDPGYRGRLMALDRVERERLLNGNWKIRPVAGTFFRREWFNLVDTAPDCDLDVRYWDLAGTKKKSDNDPCWTVGTLLGFYGEARECVKDMVRMQESPGTVKAAIITTAHIDGPFVPLFIEQEPGSASLFVIDDIRKELPGYIVEGIPSSGDKATRAKPASSAAEHGLVDVVKAAWNQAFFTEAELFPFGATKDQVDSFAGAHNNGNQLRNELMSYNDGDVVEPDIERVNISPV